MMMWPTNGRLEGDNDDDDDEVDDDDDDDDDDERRGGGGRGQSYISTKLKNYPFYIQKSAPQTSLL